MAGLHDGSTGTLPRPVRPPQPPLSFSVAIPGLLSEAAQSRGYMGFQRIECRRTIDPGILFTCQQASVTKAPETANNDPAAADVSLFCNADRVVEHAIEQAACAVFSIG